MANEIKKSNWSANSNQKLFLDTLKDNEGLTLAELSVKANHEFKTGSINPLATKGLIETKDTEIECDIVRKDNGMVVGHTKKKVKIYFLVKGE